MIPEVKFLNFENRIDPRFQNLIAQKKGLRFLSLEAENVPIIARVNNLSLFQGLGNISIGITVEDKVKKEWFVTARIPLGLFNKIAWEASVIDLVVTQNIRPLLANTIKAIELNPSAVGDQSVLDQGGEGVLIGVVDYGADFKHPNFRNSSGCTRLEFLWDQGGLSNLNSPFSQGRLYTEFDINQALDTSDPYSTLNYSPGVASHGTHVLDIAAGSGPVPGIAPKSKLAFVEIGAKSKEDSEEIENRFGDSVRLIEAVKFIFEQAKDRPCVINLSLGMNGGPHDGTNEVEKMIDILLDEKPNRAVVIAAGNAYDNSLHQSGILLSGNYVDLQWQIPKTDPVNNEVEIWYPGSDKVKLEIYNPKGVLIATLEQGQSGSIKSTQEDSKLLAFISHRVRDPKNNDNVIHIFQNAQPDFWSGVWVLRLHAETVMGDGKFHTWIDRKGGGQSFFKNDDPFYTLGSLSTGRKSIVVGSFNATQPSNPISYFSSSGPTRDGRNKPEVSAPGQFIRAAKSTSIDPVNDLKLDSGTSMAAPAVTGLIARIFGQALKNQKQLTIDNTLQILRETCQKDPPSENSQPNWRYGYGRISAKALTHPLLKA